MRGEPVSGQRAELLAHGIADIAQPAVRRPDRDVGRNAPLAGSERNRDDQAGWALVERVGRDDEDGTLPGLLASAGGVQVGEPDLATADDPHVSPRPSARVPSNSARSASSSCQAARSPAAWARRWPRPARGEPYECVRSPARSSMPWQSPQLSESTDQSTDIILEMWIIQFITSVGPTRTSLLPGPDVLQRPRCSVHH